MKSENRVHECYKKGTSDWDAEYNMLLDDGVTCAACRSVGRCVAIFGQEKTMTYCQFHPNRFTAKST